MGQFSLDSIFSEKSEKKKKKGYYFINLKLIPEEEVARDPLNLSQMTRHVILKSPLLASSEESTMRNSPTTTVVMSRERRKVGEVAGGAAAECAAVWCCCPCAVVNLVVLAVYKVPAAVCKKAWRRSKRRRFVRKRHGLLEGSESNVHARLNEEDPTTEIVFEECNKENGELNDVVRLENEMLERFYGAGFWRSPSQRDTSPGSL